MVHQYVTGVRGPGGFPAPVCNIIEGQPLWHWCEVAFWLRQNDMIQEDVVSEAQEVALINTNLAMRHHHQLDPRLSDEIAGSLAVDPQPAHARSPARKKRQSAVQ
jgi:hypothetical protein